MHSSYSILDSTIQIPAIVSKAKKSGFDSLALTDHNVLFGVEEFLKECRKNQIKPIVGMEVDCEYEVGTIIPFLVIVKDNIGYRNLCQLSTIVNSERKYCTKEELQRAVQHNTLIVYGEGGFLDHELLEFERNREKIRNRLIHLKEEFHDFYISLSYQDSELWKKSNAFLKNVARSLRIPTVAVNKIYYQEKEDFDAYQAVCAIAKRTTLDHGNIPVKKGRYFLSKEEMEYLYDVDDLKATDEIARECVADYKLPLAGLPKYETPNHVESSFYLRQLCIAGLRKRTNGVVKETYQKRLEYELKVIHQMGFDDYFLIVYDYILYARKHGISVGPGRGSAAGSLVAYCLGITMVDPIAYDLLFERFLNPERITMPDIDTDIQDDRRNEVIEYIIEKYGKEYTGNAIVFQTLGAKGAIRDVGRILKARTADIDMVLRLFSSLSDRKNDLTLSQAYQTNAKMRQMVDSSSSIRKLYFLASKLEGLPRNMAQHPAGIIVSDRKLNEVVPLISIQDSIMTTQFEAGYLEEKGLIKMDLLSLKFLTTIQRITDNIQKDDSSFQLSSMNLNDPVIYRVFSTGDTNGVFQFESEDMKKMLRQIKPSHFQDIVASNALSRPGAMAHISEFVENRNHPENITYLHPDLKPILKDTYGVMLYQEQTMRTAQQIAGFTLGKADELRKAISKKDEQAMESMHKQFVQGALNRKYDRSFVEELWNMISTFGSYGFNKSHSVAYSVISCQTAWLKGKYPLYFYQCFLDSVVGDSRKTALYIDECRRKNLKVTYPNVNHSEKGYSMHDGVLYMPLSCVKDIGNHVNKRIIDERNQNGTYQDFFDFVARCSIIDVSQKHIENLIYAGALDCFGENRKTLIENIELATSYARIVQVTRNGQQTLDFSLVSKQPLVKYKDNMREKALQEKQVLGFTLGNEEIVMLKNALHIQDPSLSTISTMYGKEVRSFGMIERVMEYTSKNNRKYCRIVITDGLSDVIVGVWPSDYAKLKDQLVVGTYIRFHGKMDETGNIQATKIAIVKREVSNGKNSHNR